MHLQCGEEVGGGRWWFGVGLRDQGRGLEIESQAAGVREFSVSEPF